LLPFSRASLMVSTLADLRQLLDARPLKPGGPY
jgi:hypothetical protein